MARSSPDHDSGAESVVGIGPGMRRGGSRRPPKSHAVRAAFAGPQLDVVRASTKSVRRIKKPLEELPMTWKTPKIVELVLGAEINCYACAELS